MEASVLSPSASSKAKLSVEDARKDLLKIFAVSGGQAGYGGPPDPKNITWCQCCGSQYLNAEGKMFLQGVGERATWATPNEARDKMVAHYRNTYGIDYIVRLGGQVTFDQLMARYDRRDRPGVTIALMEAQPAIDLLYPEMSKKEGIVESYTIKDKDHGTVTVLWTNI